MTTTSNTDFDRTLERITAHLRAQVAELVRGTLAPRRDPLGAAR